MTEAIPHLSAFTVPADHPSLPGHFPGTPVVPGVVVLDLVLKAAESWTKCRLPLSGIRQVKFHAPLLPDEPVELTLEATADALRFHIVRGDQLIAQGAFTLARPQTPRS
jgi:3-hydroxymyristoyl/3-hydroxydecanoyl-(acyl carrier protein) dehydratase